MSLQFQLACQSYTIHNQRWSMAYHRKSSLNIIGNEMHMAGESIKTVAHVWNPEHVHLIPLQFNFIPTIYLSWPIIFIYDFRWFAIYRHWLWMVYDCQTNYFRTYCTTFHLCSSLLMFVSVRVPYRMLLFNIIIIHDHRSLCLCLPFIYIVSLLFDTWSMIINV